MSERDTEVRRWVRYALEDLRESTSALERSESVARHICWLAQQAVEKAIKAILVYMQTEFPKRHDLDVLRQRIPDDWRIHSEPDDLSELTEWATEARYPGDWTEPSAADAERAVRQATVVVRDAIEDFARHGIEVENAEWLLKRN